MTIKTATLTINTIPPPLSVFSKSVAGSVALNFGLSGGVNCGTDCMYHPDSTNPNASPERARCYAATLEAGYRGRNIRAKLARHEAEPATELIDRARIEFAYKVSAQGSVPWFRFSAFGSVPVVVPDNFRTLCQEVTQAGTPIHLPVESIAKYRAYNEAVGDIVAVRLSVPAEDFHKYPDIPVSTVGGSMSCHSPAERVAVSKDMARSRSKKTGRKCIVCPAVAAQHLNTKPAQRERRKQAMKHSKCGNCTACAVSTIDIVYPVHR